MTHVGNWKGREKQEAAIRERAHKLYLNERENLAAIIVKELEPELQGDRLRDISRKLVSWMTQWEVPERQSKRRVIANITPERRMADLVVQVERFKSNLDLAEVAYDGQPTELSGRNVRHWFNLWTDATKQLLEVESEMVTQEDQGKVLDPYWKTIQHRIYVRIVRDYKGKGEIYRAMCDRLASLQVALMRLEEQGKMETSIYQALQEQFTAMAGQVQKHTEATKVDLKEEHVAEIGQRLMTIIERRLYSQPALLDQIYADLAGSMDSVIEGKPIRLLPEQASA